MRYMTQTSLVLAFALYMSLLIFGLGNEPSAFLPELKSLLADLDISDLLSSFLSIGVRDTRSFLKMSRMDLRMLMIEDDSIDHYLIDKIIDVQRKYADELIREEKDDHKDEEYEQLLKNRNKSKFIIANFFLILII